MPTLDRAIPALSSERMSSASGAEVAILRTGPTSELNRDGFGTGLRAAIALWNALYRAVTSDNRSPSDLLRLCRLPGEAVVGSLSRSGGPIVGQSRPERGTWTYGDRWLIASPRRWDFAATWKGKILATQWASNESSFNPSVAEIDSPKERLAIEFVRAKRTSAAPAADDALGRQIRGRNVDHRLHRAIFLNRLFVRLSATRELVACHLGFRDSCVHTFVS